MKKISIYLPNYQVALKPTYLTGIPNYRELRQYGNIENEKGHKAMITKRQINIINYLVICINDFAERFSMDSKTAYRFLSQYGGVEFLMQHYDIEHTLSLDDAVDDLETICRRNGGVPQ